MQTALSAPEKAPAKNRLPWLESIKALSLIWIFLNHVAERCFGSPFFGNPDAHWPSLSERISQVLSPQSPGIGGWLLTLLRDFAWLGDQGVSVFLLVSGLTLTWSCLTLNAPISWRHFYRRRILRIYPMWVVANLLMLFPLAFFGLHLSLLHPRLYLSLLGIRILPDQLYYGNSAWWFITLLLQLYIVFPLLWRLLDRLGPIRFAIIVPAAALLIRGAGLSFFHDYLDAWARGAIFITRLPEFALGMSFAVMLRRRIEDGKTAKPRGKLIPVALLSLAAGLVASFTLAGMTFAPMLLGLGTFLILYVTVSASATGDWIGRHSLALFLVHQPFVRALIPEWGANTRPMIILARLMVAALASAFAALVLEQITKAALSLLKSGQARWGGAAFSIRLASAFLVMWGVLIAADWMIRNRSPLEPWDVGWGERPSLQPDAAFGWKMHPSERLRLRWVSYDYEVQSNSLGFPGPEYPREKTPGTQRILVTGDAFTSAEGVDTNLSWPRQLERTLNQAGKPAQVLNFAITGYGPNQYERVAERFIPEFHPDTVIIGFFINDFEDALITNDEFRESIGFGRPDPNSLVTLLTFRQFAAWARGKLMSLVFDVLHRPDPDGFVLGQFAQLRTGPAGNVEKGKAVVAERLAAVQKIATQNHARLLIVLVPSGPQICRPSDLLYWPRRVNLDDSDLDADLPQKAALSIASLLHIDTLDLRPALRSLRTCSYQPLNMHWTASAHKFVADVIAQQLIKQK